MTTKSKDLTVPEKGALSAEQKELLKNTVAKGATDDELALFWHVAQKAGLDPFARQIHFSKRTNYKTNESTMTLITGIDGYRLTASRTGQYAGNDDPVFEEGQQFPVKASVTVYRIVAGTRVPFTASARWSEYFPGDKQGFMWKKMPYTMLGKCAEALALRKAFPQELSGIYTAEEMNQSGVTIEGDQLVNIEPEPAKKTPATHKAPKFDPTMHLKTIDDLIQRSGIDPVQFVEYIEGVYSKKMQQLSSVQLDDVIRKLEKRLEDNDSIQDVDYEPVNSTDISMEDIDDALGTKSQSAEQVAEAFGGEVIDDAPSTARKGMENGMNQAKQNMSAG